MRSMDVRYSLTSLQNLDIQDKGEHYRVVQGGLIGIAINYQIHSCLRNQIGRYRANKHLKTCANDAVWRQMA